MTLMAVVPAGYMPQAGAWMTICTLNGAEKIAVDQSTLPDAPAHKVKTPCAFAVLGNGADKVVAPVVILRSVTVTSVDPLLRTAQFLPPALLQGAYPVRGPPHLLG